MKKISILVITIVVSNIALAQRSDLICPNDANDPAIKSAVHWYRNSAEKEALYQEIYAIGLEYIKHQTSHRNLAPHTWGIIIDIDETALDNSLYYFKCNTVTIKDGGFSKYVATKQFSTALPGLKKTIEAVHQLGGYVTFLTNRDGSYPDVLNSTAANLKKEGIFFDQIVMANQKNAINPSDKNPRFDAVASGHYDPKQMVWSNKLPSHEIIAYFGDNIQDFPKLKQAEVMQSKNREQNFDKFGKGYFIFPNPMYGSWVKNPYN